MGFDLLFHVEDGGSAVPDHQEEALHDWIVTIILARGGKPGNINYILCGDEYLHRINVEYLAHDTYTDIITFPDGHFPEVTGDLFISTERVAENANELNLPFREELHRVIIHGILHLCGQGDKSEEEASEMRRLENWALGLRPEELTQGADAGAK